MSVTYNGVTFYDEGDRVAYRPDPEVVGVVVLAPDQREAARDDEAWVEWEDGTTTLEGNDDLVLRGEGA